MARDIVTFISKINDRNLQKRRESGLTSYAILGVLSYIMFQIIDLIPLCDLHNNTWSKITLLSVCLNVELISFIIYSVSSPEYSASAKLVSRLFVQETVTEKFCSYFIPFYPIVISILVFINRLFMLDWYILLMAIINMTFGILLIKTIFDKEDKHLKYSFKQKYEFVNVNWREVLLYTIFFVLILLSCFYYFLSVYPFAKGPIVKLSIYTLALPILGTVYFDLKKHDYKSKGLEDLEEEIYLKNLSEIEIVKMLKDKYLGVDIEGWIDLKKEHLESIKVQFLERIAKYKKAVDDANAINPNSYPAEVSFRKQKNDNEMRAIFKAITIVLDNYSLELYYLERKNWTSEERRVLNGYKTYFDNDFSKVLSASKQSLNMGLTSFA